MAAGRKFRYYAVGEYGEKSWRPHYHLIIFGLSPTEEKLVQSCWPFGFVHMGQAEQKSMGYVAQYVTKKMTNPKDARLEGRTPEFCTMSLKPGIGAGFAERMAKTYESTEGQAAFDKLGWITSTFRTNGSAYPIGRYIKKKVLANLGLDTPEAKDLHSQSVAMELYQKTAHLSASQVANERRNKLSQQNGAIRIRHKHL